MQYYGVLSLSQPVVGSRACKLTITGGVTVSAPKRWTVPVIGALLVLIAPPAQAVAAPQPCAAGYVRLTFDELHHRTATP